LLPQFVRRFPAQLIAGVRRQAEVMRLTFTAPLILLPAMASILLTGQASALICAKQTDLAEHAAGIFTATAQRMSLEPDGVPTPEIAIHKLFEPPPEVLSQLPANEEITITDCSPACKTWTGTQADLPAEIIDPWYEIVVNVHGVWRGSVGATEAIYSTAPLVLDREYVFLLRERRRGHLSFGGPCQQVFPADEEELVRSLGSPLYSLEPE
jgi:hypothetical protein